jgi:hypothetical protein
MPTNASSAVPVAPDSSDVVEGAIGSALLRDPATSGPEGAELDKLEPIALDDPTAPDPADDESS